MHGKQRGDYLLPLVFFEKNVADHFRGVILNINPEGVTVVSNDAKLMACTAEEVKRKVYHLEFNFFNLETSGIHGKVTSIRPGLFRGFEIVLDFEFHELDQVTKREITRVFLTQKLR